MRSLLILIAVAFAVPALSSHLSEEEVVAMETQCEKLRQENLAPEKAAVLKQCLAEGELDQAGCEAKAGAYGERKTGAIFRPGKYYDLPECEEAYQARRHFDVNPGR